MLWQHRQAEQICAIYVLFESQETTFISSVSYSSCTLIEKKSAEHDIVKGREVAQSLFLCQLYHSVDGLHQTVETVF